MTAVAFGVGWALAKGTSGGIRIQAGNLSAPWLVLPTLVGVAVANTRRRFSLRAGAVGTALALVSLLGFYATYAVCFDLVNSHTAENNLFVLVVGSLGAGFVALVAAYLTRELRRACLLLSLAVMAEPFFMVSYAVVLHVMRREVLTVAALEFIAGAMCLLASLALARGRASSTSGEGDVG